MTDRLPSTAVSPAARLLIVDDEPPLREALVDILHGNGFQVDSASDGREALQRLEHTSYDLMVLDIALPGLSGIEVMQRARLMNPDLAIVVLTAHAGVDSTIAAVKVGVADYMLKPFEVNDLVLSLSRALQERARQQRRERLLDMVGETMSLLQHGAESGGSRPPAAALPPTVRVGPLTVDRHKRRATVEGNPARTVELTEGEVSILLTLMENPNQVLSYRQLADTALGYEGMDRWTVESVVRSSVFRLRQKIEPQPDAPRLICTVRGRGYFFSPA
jgi:two-component system response regulator MprA